MVTASNNNQQDGHHQRLDELITMATGFVAMAVPTDHPTIDSNKVSTSFQGTTCLDKPKWMFQKNIIYFFPQNDLGMVDSQNMSGMAQSPTNQSDRICHAKLPGPDALAAVGNGVFGG